MQSESIIIQHAWIFYRLHVILLVKQINKMNMTNAISQHDTYLSGYAYYRKKNSYSFYPQKIRTTVLSGAIST